MFQGRLLGCLDDIILCSEDFAEHSWNNEIIPELTIVIKA